MKAASLSVRGVAIALTCLALPATAQGPMLWVRATAVEATDAGCAISVHVENHLGRPIKPTKLGFATTGVDGQALGTIYFGVPPLAVDGSHRAHAVAPGTPCADITALRLAQASCQVAGEGNDPAYCRGSLLLLTDVSGLELLYD